MLAAILICSGLSAEAQLERTAASHSRYPSKEAVVLRRQQIRPPLSGPESALGQLTPHEWFHWSSGKSELSLRGGVLETEMGQFFRKWLVSEGLISENHLPAEGTMRFYANSMQRTIATTQYFSSGLLPVANVEIEHHYDLNTMDPVFTPQLTAASDDYCARARQQIADLFGNGSLEGIGEKMAENYALLQDVLDVEQSAAWQTGGFSGFKVDDTNILLELNKEPGMTGSLKTACSASDALVLQYYEEPDELKAAFGHQLTLSDWEKISAVKDYYGDILFTAPLVAINVAHPLLQTILEELQTVGRQFTFLCGHDSNLGSVLAALGLSEYKLPQAIESKTPIGSKLVFEKWEGADGSQYAAINLVYQRVDQLRQMPLLMLENPPMVFPVALEGLTANEDGLYKFSDLEARFEDRIAAYDELLTDIYAPARFGAGSKKAAIYNLKGQRISDALANGVYIKDGKKMVK